MIVTEQEAKQKTCPLSFAGNSPGQRCEASGCMKWNWMPNKAPDELEARKAWDTNPKVPVGYCGA